MFRLSTTPIIRGTQNRNYSLRYWSYFFVQVPSSNVAKLVTLEGGSCPIQEAVVTVLCAHDGCGHFLCSYLRPKRPSLTTLEGGSCTVPEAVVTVLCTHDGCGWHPKHVEWTCRIINRLLCVASRWTIINTAGQYKSTPRGCSEMERIFLFQLSASTLNEHSTLAFHNLQPEKCALLRQIGRPETSVKITTTCCVTTPKSAVLIYFVAAARSHPTYSLSTFAGLLRHIYRTFNCKPNPKARRD